MKCNLLKINLKITFKTAFQDLLNFEEFNVQVVDYVQKRLRSLNRNLDWMLLKKVKSLQILNSAKGKYNC